MLMLKWLCSLGSGDLNQHLPVKQPLGSAHSEGANSGSVAARSSSSQTCLYFSADDAGLPSVAWPRPGVFPSLHGAIPPVSSPPARRLLSFPALALLLRDLVRGSRSLSFWLSTALPPCDCAATALPQRGSRSG